MLKQRKLRQSAAREMGLSKEHLDGQDYEKFFHSVNRYRHSAQHSYLGERGCKGGQASVCLLWSHNQRACNSWSQRSRRRRFFAFMECYSRYACG